MVDVNSDFCAAVENVQDQDVCQTLERLKGVDILNVPIVLKDLSGMKVVSEREWGSDTANVYGNKDFQDEFEGEAIVTRAEYKDVIDYVDQNRSNPQMTSVGLGQFHLMKERMNIIDEKYMSEPEAATQLEVKPVDIVH
jgi:hypothetical protein